MRILIAGGTGFIGKRLSAGALARSWDVYLLVRDPGSKAARDLQMQGAKLIVGDLTQTETMHAAFKVSSPDAYLHCAGWYELGIPHRAHHRMREVNVGGLENALAAARAYGEPRIVITSSTTALGDTGGEVADESFRRISPPGSWYEQTLIEANMVIERARHTGQEIIVGRPAQVIGPGDHSPYGQLFRMYLRRLLPPLVWGPEGAFSFVHVEDAARALLSLVQLGQPGEDYFIAGGVMTNREMLDTWVTALGRRGGFLWLPLPLALFTGGLTAPLLRMFGQQAFISIEVVRSSFVSFRYSSEKIRRELGVDFRGAEQAWLDTIREEQEIGART
jgi:nucleoside-diphosphate-sugar epimerase